MRWIVIATPQERAAQAMLKFGAYCEALGLQTGSEAWRLCVSQQDGSHRAGGVAAYGALKR
jgi:hypothetical protein